MKIPVSLFANYSSIDNYDSRSRCSIWRRVDDVVRVCQRGSPTTFHDALLREGGGRYPSSSLLSPNQRCAIVDHDQNMALSDLTPMPLIHGPFWNVPRVFSCQTNKHWLKHEPDPRSCHVTRTWSCLAPTDDTISRGYCKSRRDTGCMVRRCSPLNDIRQ